MRLLSTGVHLIDVSKGNSLCHVSIPYSAPSKKQNTDKKARVFLEPEKFERFFETLEGFVDFLKIPRICVSNK